MRRVSGDAERSRWVRWHPVPLTVGWCGNEGCERGGGDRQVPGDPKVAYTHVYGAPGLSGVTILSR